MLMTREHETVQANGLGAGGAFTIAASAKAFEVLSSNLYQNKTRAVIREITCNAVDAHRAAGLPISDIEVHLPTYSEMWFAVRDYGSGLSTDDVLSLYTTYFRSTKDKDNSQIGGFGLGSKSPFAVADQFTVTSWHGGSKTTFVCYKENGTPQVRQISSTPCGSETGLEVRVAVTTASGSPSAWMTQAHRLFQWWPVSPRLNVAFLEGTPSVRDPGNILLEAEATVDGLPAWSVYPHLDKTVVMGGVPYRLDLTAIPAFPEALFRIVGSIGFHLALPIGAVNISPSREALSYDPPTCQALIKAIGAFAKQLVAHVETVIDKQPTLVAAREFLYGSSSSGLVSVLTANNSAVIRWKGKPVHRQVTLDLTAFSTPGKMTVYEKRYYLTNFRNTGNVHDHSMAHHYLKSSTLILAWTSKITSKTYRTLKHNYGKISSNKGDVYIHLLHGMPYDELVARCEELGIPRPVNAETELEEAPTNASAGKTGRLHATQYYVMTPTSTALQYTTERGTLDLTGGGIYVPMREGHIAGDYKEMAVHLAGLQINGWAARRRIIGLSLAKLKANSKLKKALTTHGWIELSRTAVQADILVPEIQKSAGLSAWREFRDRLGKARRTILYKGIHLANQGTPWPGFEPIHALMNPHYKMFTGLSSFAAVDYSSYTALKAMAIMTQQQAAEVAKACPPVDEFDKVWQGFVAQHPLLTYLYSEADVDPAHLTAYFNR